MRGCRCYGRVATQRPTFGGPIKTLCVDANAGSFAPISMCQCATVAWWNPVVDGAEELERRRLRGSRAHLHLRGPGCRSRCQESWACGAKRRLQAVQGRVHPKELDGLQHNWPPLDSDSKEGERDNRWSEYRIGHFLIKITYYSI